MDMNYLYHRQQTELMRAAEAACPQAQRAHRELAEEYGRKIAERRELFAMPSRRR
ncbi:MAG TPA: hypothetical protein VI381_05825 [Allosphingosinicella sp.]